MKRNRRQEVNMEDKNKMKREELRERDEEDRRTGGKRRKMME